MEHITLFTKISPEEQELMRVCFCAGAGVTVGMNPFNLSNT